MSKQSSALGFVIVLTLLFAAVSGQTLFAQNKELSADEKSVTLYGQNFTIDPSFINKMQGDDVPYKWEDIAYLVPEILPGILNGEEKKSVQGVLETVSQWAAKYRYDIYECTIYRLAVKMDEQGMLDAAYTYENDEEVYYSAVPERFTNATQQERIDAIYGAIGYWISQGTWQEQIEGYNALRKEALLSPHEFANAVKFYHYSLALNNLEQVLRKSPEVQKAELQNYGRVAPWTAKCFEGIGSDDYSQDTLDGDNRDREPLPLSASPSQ